MPRAGLDPTRIVKEAARLADERGLEAVTLLALAKRLHVRAPSLYKHIDGLPELRRLLAIEGSRALREALAPSILGLAGDDAVRSMAEAYRTFALAHPGLYAASLAAPAKADKARVAEVQQTFDLVAAALRSFDIADEHLIHVVRGLRAALHGFVSLEMAGAFGMPESVDESFERLVEVLLAQLKASAGAFPPGRRPKASASH